MTCPMSLQTTLDKLVRLGRSTSDSHPGLQVFLPTDDFDAVRTLACELSKCLTPGRATPLYVWSGLSNIDYLGLDWRGGPPGGCLLPRSEPVILLIEHFDSIELGMQRSYAHLVDGDPVKYALAQGSILLLHVVPDGGRGRLERGTLDRGIWMKVPSDGAPIG